MRVIRKRPGQVPQIVDVENTLESLQFEVDGWIEAVTFAEDACVICNEEGRIQGLPFNLELMGILFFGTILIVGVDGENFTDLSDAGRGIDDAGDGGMKTTTETRFHYLASDFCDNYCRRPREIKDQDELYELCKEDCPLNRLRELLEDIENGAKKEPAADPAAGDGADCA